MKQKFFSLSIWNYIDNLIATVLKVNPNEKIEDGNFF